MRRVVQISDLHFGNNDPLLLAPLRRSIEQLNPDLLIISGDLVEHATKQEFAAACDFMKSLPSPQMVVPGNHDLPFYNLFERATIGLGRYKKQITSDLWPKYQDEEISVFGANTSRLWPIRGGSLSSLQLERLAAAFAGVPDDHVRLLVTHHPFDLPEGQGHRLIVGHARRAINRLAPLVDILLAGHIHLSSTGSTATRYKTAGHAMAFVQAGTAVSNRDKGETNSFNLLRISNSTEVGKTVIVDRYTWDKGQQHFYCKQSTEFRLEREGWAQKKATLPADSTVEEAAGIRQP